MRTPYLTPVLLLLCLLIAAAAAMAEEAGPPAVEVHGWSLTRYYVDVAVNDSISDTGVISDKEEKSFLAWERFSLSGLARLPEGRQAYAEIYLHPWLPYSDPTFLYLESLYLDVPADATTTYRIGKGRSYAFGITPTYGARKTSNYGPLAEAFTMDRALGVQYLHKMGADSVNLGIFNSQRVGGRYIGMTADEQLERGSLARTSVLHLCDRDSPASRSGELETSVRYGHQMGDLNVGLSGRLGALDSTDAAFLARNFSNYNGTNKTRLQYGVDATYKRVPYYGTFEYYGGTLGGIGLDGYAIVVGVEPTRDCAGIWREFSRACKGLFVRYTNIDVDTPTTLRPITWDTSQLAVSYVLPIKIKQAPLIKWLQIEYERNKEQPPAGASEIPNDVFFIEAFSAF